jgi:hypothetical protein
LTEPFPRLANRPFHTTSARADRLVCPDADDRPSCLLEVGISAPVTRDVGLDLLPPPFRVRLRPGHVFRAAVPEATVDEDSNSGTRENDVGAPAS